MAEYWKYIKGYNRNYEISNYGRVKSVKYGKERILKNQLTGPKNRQYHSVGLHNENGQKMVLVHKLMAITFLNHIPNGRNIVVDHINNNQFDNTLGNIQIISHRENVTKDLKPGLSQFVGVTLNRSTGKWISYIQIDNHKIYLGTFEDEMDAGIAYQEALLNLLKEVK